MTESVDQYLEEGCGRCTLGGTPDCKVHRWTRELNMLRELVASCGLDEQAKWGVPVYTYDGKNILIISAFKDSCSISFFKGSLLQNSKKLLVSPGPKSQASRLFKFQGMDEIRKIDSDIRSYIFEAVEIEKAGLKIEYVQNPEPIPTELEDRFKEDHSFKAAFEALTPGRQRGYIIHFSQPKQSKTRISRIEKCTSMILQGIGLHDKYRSGKR